jgi:hypothetical protein
VKDVVMNQSAINVLVVLIAMLIGIIAALVTGMLSRLGGAAITTALIRGAMGFGGTVTLVLLIEHALGM